MLGFLKCYMKILTESSGVPRGGGSTPPSKNSKALQNRAKLTRIVKTVKKLLNLRRQHPKMFGKKAVKF